MAIALHGMGRNKEALAHYERALALREKALGPEPALVAASLNTDVGNKTRRAKRSTCKRWQSPRWPARRG